MRVVSTLETNCPPLPSPTKKITNVNKSSSRDEDEDDGEQT